MTLFGVDLSDYDRGRGPVDVASMASDGISFLTHKATEGVSGRHQYLAETLNAARAAGIECIGAYHVVRSLDAAAQVRWYLSTLDAAVPWWRTFPGFFLQVDLEVWSYDRVSAATGAAFAGQLRAAQPKTVVMYASRGQYGDQLVGVPTELWNAAYGTDPVAHYRAAYPGDNASGWRPYSGRTPVMLQYGSRLTIGTQPGCDANAFRGSVDELRALIEGGTVGDFSDPAFADALAWRVDALGHLKDLVAGGPTKNEPMQVVALLKQLRDDLLTAKAAAAADETRDAATLAAIQALASGGTSVDTTAVIGAIKVAAADSAAAVVALHDQVAALGAELAAAHATIEQLRTGEVAEAQAELAALDPPHS